MTVIERWTITSAYTERDTGDPDCPNYRVGATVKGPEQREPIEVVPAQQLQALLERIGALARNEHVGATHALQNIARLVDEALLARPGGQ